MGEYLKAGHLHVITNDILVPPRASVPQNGRVPNRSERPTPASTNLTPSSAIAFDHIRGLGLDSAVVVGGAALEAHGVRPSTDVDVLLDPEEFAALGTIFTLDTTDFPRYATSIQVPGGEEKQIEFFTLHGPYSRRRTRDLHQSAAEHHGLRVASPSAVVEHKVSLLGRPKDFADAALLKGAA